MKDDEQIREAVGRWRSSRTDQQESHDQLISLLFQKLSEKYTMVDLEEITGIKRTTLYYMMYGKEGKNGQPAA